MPIAKHEPSSSTFLRDLITKLGVSKTVLIITAIAMAMAFLFVFASSLVFVHLLQEPYNYFAATIQIIITVLFIAPPISWIIVKSYLRIHELETIYSDLARYDELTGLMNRRTFFATLDNYLSQHQNEPFSLTLIDLDFFKQVNDQYGHQAGDITLQNFAERLMQIGKEFDCACCRLGGEEFLVLLPNASVDKAREFDNKLRETLEANPIELDETHHIIQYSAGLFHAKGFNTDITLDHIICSVDKAMYQAKESGRNQTIEEMAASV